MIIRRGKLCMTYNYSRSSLQVETKGDKSCRRTTAPTVVRDKVGAGSEK